MWCPNLAGRWVLGRGRGVGTGKCHAAVTERYYSAVSGLGSKPLPRHLPESALQGWNLVTPCSEPRSTPWPHTAPGYGNPGGANKQWLLLVCPGIPGGPLGQVPTV